MKNSKRPRRSTTAAIVPMTMPAMAPAERSSLLPSSTLSEPIASIATIVGSGEVAGNVACATVKFSRS